MENSFPLKINPDYEDMTSLKGCWQGKSKSADFEIYQGPFRSGILRNFLVESPTERSEEGFLAELEDEIQSLKMIDKDNDLYKLKQSPDLATLSSTENPHLVQLRDLFMGPVLEWMSKLTGIEFRRDYVPLTVSVYNYTDTLLCHDDELEDRRIAFVLYLTRDWTEEMGGQLILFDSDQAGNPGKVQRQLVPQHNSLSFFEVSAKSFHQVAEVVKKDSSRLSVNGWFHGPPIPRPVPSPQTLPVIIKPRQVEYSDVITWINPDYLNSDIQKQIREKFEEDSEIELQNFLQDDKYEAVVAELAAQDLEIDKICVPNKRHFSLIEAGKNADCMLRKCKNILESEAMYILLTQLTGLNFHPLADKEVAQSSSLAETPTSKEGSSGSELEVPMSTPTVVVSQVGPCPGSARKRKLSRSPSPLPSKSNNSPNNNNNPPPSKADKLDTHDENNSDGIFIEKTNKTKSINQSKLYSVKE